jgi:hypothetical protein
MNHIQIKAGHYVILTHAEEMVQVLSDLT